MRRILILGAVAVLVVLALGRFVLLPALGRAVMQAVETRGSELTQTAVSVEGTEFDLAHSRGILSNLRVANPDGFRSEYALSVERLAVTVDAATLRSDPIVLKEVVVESPTLIYEFGTGNNNIAVIRRSIEARVAAEDEEARSGGSGRARLVVKSLRVTHGRVRILSSKFFGGQEFTGRLPDVHLTDIGTTVGTSAGKVVQELLAALTKGVRTNLRSLDLHGGGGPSGTHR